MSLINVGEITSAFGHLGAYGHNWATVSAGFEKRNHDMAYDMLSGLKGNEFIHSWQFRGGSRDRSWVDELWSIFHI